MYTWDGSSTGKYRNTFTNMQGSYFLFENKILKRITSIQYTCFLVKRDIDATHLDLKKI